MRMQSVVIASALAMTTMLSAQTTPGTTVCLTKIEGPESQNWNLRPSILKELSREFVEQRRSVSVVGLDATDEKHSRTEAAEKHCDFVVHSIIERLPGEVNSQMNPSITKRGIANPDATTGSSILRYSFKIKNANRGKVADGKEQVELMPSFGPKEYQQRGALLISDVVDKIVAAIP
jgi:hypothetical protein